MARKRKKPASSFVALERKLLHLAQWRALPGSEKILYLYIKGRYAPGNNGKIVLPYSAMKGVEGCTNDRTISKAFQGLIEKQWITREQRGGLYRRINKYGLTWKWDHYDGATINEDKYETMKKRYKNAKRKN